MKEQDIELLSQWIFRSPGPEDPRVRPKAYAILDAARDPRIFRATSETTLPTRCLFEGQLDPALKAAAPYLVELQPGAPLVRLMLEKGWGEAWGIFVLSPVSLEDLRRHFRRFLQVVDEHGKRLFFRYYDPRVLRPYLPTCNEGELATVFGPVTRYVVEGEKPDAILEFSLQSGKLSTRTIDWKAQAQVKAEAR